MEFVSLQLKDQIKKRLSSASIYKKVTQKNHGFCPVAFLLSLNRNNLTAVRCINIKRTAIHNKKTLLVINSKESN